MENGLTSQLLTNDYHRHREKRENAATSQMLTNDYHSDRQDKRAPAKTGFLTATNTASTLHFALKCMWGGTFGAAYMSRLASILSCAQQRHGKPVSYYRRVAQILAKLREKHPSFRSLYRHSRHTGILSGGLFGEPETHPTGPVMCIENIPKRTCPAPRGRRAATFPRPPGS